MTGTEPCPWCDGTGRRLVPPPPDTRGGRRTGGRRHGYVATYTWGCRCELCRAAWRVYHAKRRRDEAS